MSQKQRLDSRVAALEGCDSRKQAQRLIRAGKVFVDGHPATKPGLQYGPDVDISVTQPPPFVSRGGEKLQAAFDTFSWAVRDCVCIDIGASTGGFTDCLLQHGAEHVYAVDVGRGQLHDKLRRDPRVDSRERVNARYLTAKDFSPRPTRAVMDVSFISLTKILPAVSQILNHPSHMITLIKPQFEAGRRDIEKGGVVRDPHIHEAVVSTVRTFGETECGFQWEGVVRSPLTGPAGNIEFLAHWTHA